MQQTLSFATPKPETRKLKKLSPSSINSYRRCKRTFYNTYILGIKCPVTIQMVKGNIAHNVLERFYAKYFPYPRKHIFNLLRQEWKKSKDLIALELSKEDDKRHFTDCNQMLMNLLNRDLDTMQGLMLSGKVENERHAFYLIRPKFREKYLEIPELMVCGYLDRVQDDPYENVTTIGDYKTGNKYGIKMPIDVRRQGAIYSLMYNHLNPENPATFFAVIYLRYGAYYYIEITDRLIEYARSEIKDVWEKTRSNNIEDYPQCTYDKCFCKTVEATCSEKI